MKIDYWSHCFEDGISYENITFNSTDNDGGKDKENKFRELLLKILDNTNNEVIVENIYRWEISHEYEKELDVDIKVAKSKVINYIKKYNFTENKSNWHNFFELVKESIIELGLNKYSDSCEQCGDYNEAYSLSLNN